MIRVIIRRHRKPSLFGYAGRIAILGLIVSLVILYGCALA